GGSDLTAVVVARALGARCRLIKDVGGVYPSDPSQGGRIGRPFARLGWDEAERLAGRVIQAEALRCARDGGVRLEVGGLVSGFRTRIGAQGTALAARIPPRGRLRVVLLGLGTVGRGVLEHLERMRDRFEVVAIAVRRPERHEGVSPHLLTTDAVATAAGECDVVVEMLGGDEPARSAVAAALAAGHDVVSANKLVMATGVTLRARCSAAVGGAVPMLETVRRLRRRGRILMIEAVLNGTTNFILDCLRQGASFAGALAEAQRLGYAEADLALDLDGTDAALKLVLLARAAFGKCSLEDIVWNGIPRSGRGGVVRLVARTWKESGGVRGVIGPQRLHRSHPLAAVRGADNAMIVHSAVAGTVTVWGRGAGRWPTAEAVVSDLLDLWRLRVERRSGREVGAAES
ncbi:MAG TPA: homoserine dehydrogenase, partial [Gemmatimonadales bacterium]|nr:homoserine dehydrogenase [Gemmatimonadales bacterium]